MISKKDEWLEPDWLGLLPTTGSLTLDKLLTFICAGFYIYKKK